MRNCPILCLVAVLLLVTPANAADATGAHVIHAKLTPAAWAARYITFVGPDNRMDLRQRLPDTIVYDAAGLQLAERQGYDGRGPAWLASVLEKEPPAKAPLLKDLVRELTTPDGNAFPAVFPGGEPVVAVFGAVWCAPCRALKADLEKVSGITILDLDVDRANMNWSQVMESVKDTAPH